jgi:hypothetical protein
VEQSVSARQLREALVTAHRGITRRLGPNRSFFGSVEGVSCVTQKGHGPRSHDACGHQSPRVARSHIGYPFERGTSLSGVEVEPGAVGYQLTARIVGHPRFGVFKDLFGLGSTAETEEQVVGARQGSTLSQVLVE